MFVSFQCYSNVVTTTSEEVLIWCCEVTHTNTRMSTFCAEGLHQERFLCNLITPLFTSHVIEK